MFKFKHGFSLTRILPPKLRKNGFDYYLVIRNEKVAVYMQRYTENVKYFEVFKIKVKPAVQFKGKWLPEREAFPSDSDFGVTAWSYRNQVDAFRKLAELTRQNKKGMLINNRELQLNIK